MNRRSKRRSALGNALGVLTVVYLAFLWMIVLNPLEWNVSFPGGLQGGFFTMLAAMLTSTLAALWGNRTWWMVVAMAVGSFVYIGFIYPLPYWY